VGVGRNELVAQLVGPDGKPVDAEFARTEVSFVVEAPPEGAFGYVRASK
jgi:hypothetical protein